MNLQMDHPSVSTFQLRVSESGTRRSLQKIMNYLKAYVEPLGSVMVEGQSSAAVCDQFRLSGLVMRGVD